MVLRKALSPAASSVMLIIAVVVLAFGIYAINMKYFSGVLSASGSSMRDVILVDCVSRLPSGGLSFL